MRRELAALQQARAPLPPRPVTSYFAVLIVCSLPRRRLDAHQVAVAASMR